MQDTDITGTSTRRILVAEDDLIGQAVIRKVLEDAGYSVAVVGDGRAVLRALKAAAYDLVVMDCSMPLLDGFETTRAIRSNDSGWVNPAIPIIALTALTLKGDRESCLQAGMDDYVGKPVDAGQLLTVIGRFLGSETTVGVAGSGHGWQTQPAWDDDFIDGLIDKFLADLPEVVKALEAAFTLKNSKKLQQIAHRLRGASDLLNATTLSDRANALEQACKSSGEASINRLTTELIQELNKLIAEQGEVL